MFHFSFKAKKFPELGVFSAVHLDALLQSVVFCGYRALEKVDVFGDHRDLVFVAGSAYAAVFVVVVILTIFEA